MTTPTTFLCREPRDTTAALDLARQSRTTVVLRPVADSRQELRHLELHELSRLRAAAAYAVRVFPGAVGEVLARELAAHADLGYQFGRDGLVHRLATEILSMRTPRP
jgi:hypothetical protein